MIAIDMCNVYIITMKGSYFKWNKYLQQLNWVVQIVSASNIMSDVKSITTSQIYSSKM